MSTAMLLAVGTISCSSPSRFAALSKKMYPGDVAARPIEASDKAERYGVTADPEDDRNRRGRLLRCADPIVGGRKHDGHLTANQIGCQRRHAIVLTLRKAVFDSHVLAFDIADF